MADRHTGMRELRLLASETSLDSGFPEIAAPAEQCRFADYRHEQEPECAVRPALEGGRVSPGRWVSCAKLQRETRHDALKADARARRTEKQVWKQRRFIKPKNECTGNGVINTLLRFTHAITERCSIPGGSWPLAGPSEIATSPFSTRLE
jgi:hypothetical protein